MLDLLVEADSVDEILLSPDEAAEDLVLSGALISGDSTFFSTFVLLAPFPSDLTSWAPSLLPWVPRSSRRSGEGLGLATRASLLRTSRETTGERDWALLSFCVVGFVVFVL